MQTIDQDTLQAALSRINHKFPTRAQLAKSAAYLLADIDRDADCEAKERSASQLQTDMLRFLLFPRSEPAFDPCAGGQSESAQRRRKPIAWIMSAMAVKDFRDYFNNAVLCRVGKDSYFAVATNGDRLHAWKTAATDKAVSKELAEKGIPVPAAWIQDGERLAMRALPIDANQRIAGEAISWPNWPRLFPADAVEDPATYCARHMERITLDACKAGIGGGIKGRDRVVVEIMGRWYCLDYVLEAANGRQAFNACLHGNCLILKPDLYGHEALAIVSDIRAR